MRNIRVRYQKKGLIRFTSHLDMMRAFSRAFNRTDIAIYYTEGFNPHPYLVLGLPLSLGFESECDLCDFRVTDDQDLREIVAELQRALPPGIQILSAAENGMPLGKIAYVRYRTELRCAAGYTAEHCEQLRRFFEREEIPMEKKSKRGLQTVNIRPLIEEIAVEQTEDGVLRIDSLLAAGNGSLNPDLIVRAIGQYESAFPLETVRHCRKKILTEDQETFV